MKRPWKLAYNSPDTIIWTQRGCDSTIVRLNKQPSGQWTGVSYFGNWHFPVPGLKIYYLGPFNSRTAGINGARAWMKDNPEPNHYNLPQRQSHVQS